MSKEKKIRKAIAILENIALEEVLQTTQPKEPQYLYAWLDKMEGSIYWAFEEVGGILEDDEFKYLGKLEVKP